ncbi:tectonic-1-like isoform X2 [Cloeon dipterum]|uniref:tectonic-1-like isoform X2 n=1 Tax=Cloeon dipterum TaxID=197152 RepID=UPI00322094BB
MNVICILNITFFIAGLTVHLSDGAKVYGKNTRANLKSALNETKRASNSTSRADRSYLNPYFLASEPSGCDLTPNYCDLHCCSDKDCSASQKAAFQCVTETEFNAKSNFWSCKEKSNLSSWHAFICYVTDNSPYLGRHFLTPPDHVTDYAKFSKLAENVYQFPSDSKVDLESNHLIYQFGSRLTLLPNNHSEEFLSMPDKIPGTNFCSRDKPIRYLKNRRTYCLRHLTAKSCEEHPVSIEKFLDKTLSKTVSSLEGMISTVNFLCMNKTSARRFMRIMKRDSRELGYFLNYDWRGEFTNCSETQFLSSFFDPRTKICYNSLLGVDYTIFWNGTNITSVETTFRLADIDVLEWRIKTSPKFYLSQQFSVSFQHAENTSSVSNETNSNFTEFAEIAAGVRSGNPGYQDGNNLIVGNLFNSTHESGNETFEWENGFLNLFISGPDGNCANVVPASFGYDTITSCKYKLQKEEINNCTLLSESMADFVSSLISGEHAGKRGDLKFESMADVVPILWSGVDDNSSEQVGGCVVASGISIKVLFSEHLLASGVKLSRLVGLRIENFCCFVALWQSTCLCQRRRHFLFPLRSSFSESTHLLRGQSFGCA